MPAVILRLANRLAAVAALSIGFISIFRYIEEINIHASVDDVSLIRSFISGVKMCHASNGSILDASTSNNRSTLIILLDGYPSPLVYKYLTGRQSRLHQYLASVSTIKVEAYTPIDNTAYSLAYILAGSNKPKKDCRFPSIASHSSINLLLANQYFSDKKSICREYLPFGWMPFLEKVRSGGLLLLTKGRLLSSLLSMPRECSLLSGTLLKALLQRIEEANSTPRPKALMVHDVLWHDYALLQGKNAESMTLLEHVLSYIDDSYRINLAELIHVLSGSSAVDDILIMSDHGPRLKIPAGPKASDKVFGRDSLPALANRFSFFVYYISLKKDAPSKRITTALYRLERTKHSVYYEVDQHGLPRLLGPLLSRDKNS